MNRFILSAAALVSFAVSGVAHADNKTVVVTSGSGLPSATSWGTIPSEDTGGGSGAITGTVGRSGNGSVELRGDRSRFQLGIQYSPFTTNIIPLNQVTGLSFDWRIAADSSGGYNVDQTPALRLLVQDGNARSELIWEGAYNGTYGNTARDTWYTTTFNDNFYQNVAGAGVTLVNGQQVNQTIASWIANNYSANAYVSGISVGVGSGFSANYHAFADNVVLGTTSGNTTYNFEASATGAVPEPASWAMLMVGFGSAGAMLRRRRKATARTALA